MSVVTISAKTMEEVRRERLVGARKMARQIELFSYGVLQDAVGEEQIKRARDISRQAVGLRRMLDNWR